MTNHPKPAPAPSSSTGGREMNVHFTKQALSVDAPWTAQRKMKPTWFTLCRRRVREQKRITMVPALVTCRFCLSKMESPAPASSPSVLEQLVLSLKQDVDGMVCVEGPQPCRKCRLGARLNQLAAALAAAESQRDEYWADLCEVKAGSGVVPQALYDEAMKRAAAAESRQRELEQERDKAIEERNRTKAFFADASPKSQAALDKFIAEKEAAEALSAQQAERLGERIKELEDALLSQCSLCAPPNLYREDYDEQCWCAFNSGFRDDHDETCQRAKQALTRKN